MVFASLGKMLVVTPSSAPMFVIVALCGTERVLTPGPKYSATQPTFPFVVRMLSSFRITSFAATHGFNFPVSFMPTTLGQVKKKGPPAIAAATSIPPAPIASIPIPPPVGVCESLPRRVFSGLPKRSRWTW